VSKIVFPGVSEGSKDFKWVAGFSMLGVELDIRFPDDG
jgi:hypothetical protein